MKRVVMLLLSFTGACASLPGAGRQAGAASPKAAIDQFLLAASRQDLPALTAVWGTDKGSVSKTLPKQELERREFIMIRCLGHEKATVGSSAPGEAGRLRVTVEMTAGARTAKPAFTVVRGPNDRWYVENFEIDHLRDQGFCGALTAPPAS